MFPNLCRTTLGSLSIVQPLLRVVLPLLQPPPHPPQPPPFLSPEVAEEIHLLSGWEAFWPSAGSITDEEALLGFTAASPACASDCSSVSCSSPSRNGASTLHLATHTKLVHPHQPPPACLRMPRARQQT